MLPGPLTLHKGRNIALLAKHDAAAAAAAATAAAATPAASA